MNTKTNCAMNASHTPGPFKVIVAEYFAKGMFQIVTDEHCPATIAFVCDDIPDGEANARLFASAIAESLGVTRLQLNSMCHDLRRQREAK